MPETLLATFPLCWTVLVPTKVHCGLSGSGFFPGRTVSAKSSRRVGTKRPRCRILASDDALPQESGLEPDLQKAQSQSELFFKRLRDVTEAESALTNPLGLKKSYEVLRFDSSVQEEGPRDRYVYVEERDCIGCTHCSTTATGTFFMESEYGRARVFDQMGDADSVVEEAIDTCPVNCIYYVDWQDLVALEDMRDGQQINNKARLVGGQDFGADTKGKVKTTVMDSGIMRCQNCPKRGCAECPLYGVGNNPEYKRKKAMREAKAQKRKPSSDPKPRRRI